MRIRNGFTVVEVMIVIAIIGLLAAIVVPNFARAKRESQRNLCFSNLRKLESAKQDWARETKAATMAVPAISDIMPYLAKAGMSNAPFCPLDANKSFATSYKLNAVIRDPTCLVGTNGSYRHVLNLTDKVADD